MRKRQLGNTGMQVSEIAFGGVEIGMPYGIGVKSAKDMLSEKEAVHLLRSALDAGINFFDTARQYGQSESIMGNAFKNNRQQVVLATKCKHMRDKEGALPSRPILRNTLESSLSESLEALQTDYIDLYMLHDSDSEILESEEVLRFFNTQKQSVPPASARPSTIHFP